MAVGIVGYRAYSDIKHGGKKYAAGTLIEPGVLDEIAVEILLLAGAIDPVERLDIEGPNIETGGNATEIISDDMGGGPADTDVGRLAGADDDRERVPVAEAVKAKAGQRKSASKS